MPEDGTRYEIIDGALFSSRAPGLTHQLICTNLVAVIRIYLDQHPIGIVVARPGLIFDDFNGVIPDIIFVSNEKRGSIASGERVTGAPDLVIEILSPGESDERRDRAIKRQLYGKFGVREYWIVNPAARAIEVYVSDGRSLVMARTFSGEDELTSYVLPAFSLHRVFAI
jgi:Uma2 family endonuclease